MTAKSHFVWHDLNTRNAESAQGFYGELFGWTFDKGQGGPYLHIKAGDQMIGGLRQMGADEHMPPHWLPYVNVDDVEATAKRMTESGAKVFMPATTMENVGTFAVVADPTGGVLAPWKSARSEEDNERAGRPATHTFCWDELLTSDAPRAADFYAKVFGWGIEKMDMGPMGTYTVLTRPGVKDEQGKDKNAGGIMQSPPDAPHPPFWLTYVAVANADATVEKAKRLGGKAMVEPKDIPNVGRFAVLTDSESVAFGILQP